MELITNTELSKIAEWLRLNKLSLNIKKTNYILFGNKSGSNRTAPRILIDNNQIERVYQTKFLGVIINQSLNWSDHINTIKQKVTKNLGIILKIRKHLPDTVLRSLYFSLIHPYYEYCNIVWAIHHTNALNQLFITQKRQYV